MIIIHEYNSKPSRIFVNEAIESGQNPSVYTLDQLQEEFPGQQVYMTIRAYPTVLCMYDAYWDPDAPIYDPDWVYDETKPDEGPTIIAYGMNVPAGVLNLELDMELEINGQTITIRNYGDCLKYYDQTIIRAHKNPPHLEE